MSGSPIIQDGKQMISSDWIEEMTSPRAVESKHLKVVVAVASYFKPTVFERVDFIREYIEPLVRCNDEIIVS